jgi:hypothetical protein
MLKSKGVDGISNAFITVSPFFKIYAEYMAGYSYAVTFINEHQAMDPLKLFLRDAKQRCNGVLLPTLLALPTNALSKYISSLNEISQLVSPSSPQYAQLQVALGIVMDAQSRSAQVGKVKEEGEVLLEIQDMLGISIIEPHRRLVRKGKLLMLNKQDMKWIDVSLYLFNDVLCIGVYKDKNKFAKAQSTLIRLGTADVADISPGDDTSAITGFVFKIITPNSLSSKMIKASSATSKRAWMGDIANCIAGVKQSLSFLHENAAAELGLAAVPIASFSPSSMRLTRTSPERSPSVTERESTAGSAFAVPDDEVYRRRNTLEEELKRLSVKSVKYRSVVDSSGLGLGESLGNDGIGTPLDIIVDDDDGVGAGDQYNSPSPRRGEMKHDSVGLIPLPPPLPASMHNGTTSDSGGDPFVKGRDRSFTVREGSKHDSVGLIPLPPPLPPHMVQDRVASAPSVTNPPQRLTPPKPPPKKGHRTTASMPSVSVSSLASISASVAEAAERFSSAAVTDDVAMEGVILAMESSNPPPSSRIGKMPPSYVPRKAKPLPKPLSTPPVSFEVAAYGSEGVEGEAAVTYEPAGFARSVASEAAQLAADTQERRASFHEGEGVIMPLIVKKKPPPLPPLRK